MVVTATYVSKDDIDFLLELKVKDSKKLTDNDILKIVPKIIERIKYNTIVVHNNEYNDYYKKILIWTKWKPYYITKPYFILLIITINMTKL